MSAFPEDVDAMECVQALLSMKNDKSGTLVAGSASGAGQPSAISDVAPSTGFTAINQSVEDPVPSDINPFSTLTLPKGKGKGKAVDQSYSIPLRRSPRSSGSRSPVYKETSSIRPRTAARNKKASPSPVERATKHKRSIVSKSSSPRSSAEPSSPAKGKGSKGPYGEKNLTDEQIAERLQHNEEEPCGFMADCITGAPRRKVISHIFGRNKNNTKLIGNALWIMYCRKHYQREKYRDKFSWARAQSRLILRQFDRLEQWGEIMFYNVQPRKAEQVRLDKENGGSVAQLVARDLTTTTTESNDAGKSVAGAEATEIDESTQLIDKVESDVEMTLETNEPVTPEPKGKGKGKGKGKAKAKAKQPKTKRKHRKTVESEEAKLKGHWAWLLDHLGRNTSAQLFELLKKIDFMLHNTPSLDFPALEFLPEVSVEEAEATQKAKKAKAAAKQREARHAKAAERLAQETGSQEAEEKITDEAKDATAEASVEAYDPSTEVNMEDPEVSESDDMTVTDYEASSSEASD